MNELSDAWTKFYRAEKHLETVEEILGFFAASNKEPFIRETNCDGTHEDFRNSFAGFTLDRQTNAIFGDFIHNLRSVFDHVAMALAIKSGASRDDRTIAFPLCDITDDFSRQKWHIKKITTPGAQAFIEGLQPYKRPSDLWPFSELEFLDNRDKHRAINLQQLSATIETRVPYGVRVESFPDALVDGAVFMRITYPTAYSGMKVNPEVITRVFIEGKAGRIWSNAFRDSFLPLVKVNAT